MRPNTPKSAEVSRLRAYYDLADVMRILSEAPDVDLLLRAITDFYPRPSAMLDLEEERAWRSFQGLAENLMEAREEVSNETE